MGGDHSGEKAEKQVAENQQKTADQWGTIAQSQLGKMNEAYAPVIAQDQSTIANAGKGNYSQLVSGAGPALGINAQQEQAAAANLMRTGPAGPGRDAALAELPISEANSNAAALNDAYKSAIASLTQLGASEGGVGLQAGGAQISSQQGAANSFGQVAQNQAQDKASTMSVFSGLAGAAGSVAAGGFGKGGAWGCWIAEALYGVDDIRTLLLRAWLNGPFRRSFPGNAIMWVYCKIGRQVAFMAARSALLRACLRPLFDLGLRKATR